MSHTYLVTGATGNIGRSVVSTLLSLGHNVHAYTRNTSSRAAQELESLGAILFQGDFTTPSALSAASSGCSGIFLITIPGPSAAKDAETALTAFRSSCLPGAAVVCVTSIWQNEASTKLLQSPNAGMPNKPPHPFVQEYWKMNDDVERVVKGSQIPHWTILRPCWFMSNYCDFHVRPMQWPALSTEKKLVAGIVGPETLFEMNDPHDIGLFAAHALAEKGQERWEGKCLDLASELLTLEEKAAIISRVSGVPISAVFRSNAEAARLAEDDFMGYLHLWHANLAPKVDMEEMRSYGFELGTFEAYLTRNKEALIRALNDGNAALPAAGLSSEQLLAPAGSHG